jgi:hypothetical protein
MYITQEGLRMLNAEWVEYEQRARERAQAETKTDDPAVQAAIAAISARKRRIMVLEVSGVLAVAQALVRGGQVTGCDPEVLGDLT